MLTISRLRALPSRLQPSSGPFIPSPPLSPCSLRCAWLLNYQHRASFPEKTAVLATPLFARVSGLHMQSILIEGKDHGYMLICDIKKRMALVNGYTSSSSNIMWG